MRAPSTYHAFGNNGSVPLNQGVDAPANTALGDLPNRLAVLYDLARVCSDHLPVVQHYRILQPPGPATYFRVTADANPVVAGAAFGITVAALDANDQLAIGYQGTVHFTSADPYGATVPADYSYQPSDAGTHTFAGGVTLYTAGSWDVTATDTASNLTGSIHVMVIAAPAVTFRVIAPPAALSGTPFDITVVAVDSFGNTDNNYQGTVTFTTSDPALRVVLPADYAFTTGDGGDNGVHAFPAGVTLIAVGDQTITATDTANGTITGNATITVTSPAAPPGGGRPRTPTMNAEMTPAQDMQSAQQVALLERLFSSLTDEKLALTLPLRSWHHEVDPWLMAVLDPDQGKRQ